jgi:NAD+ synthase (glutamine-hydrolysing)
MKIALCQINTTVGDSLNVDKIVDYMKKAESANADLAVFPELSVVGYPVRDLADYSYFVDKAERDLNTLAKNTKGYKVAIIVGCITKNKNGKPYNSAVYIKNGNIEFIQSKILLPTYDVFDERRNFESAEYQHLLYSDIPIGISVCEDIWGQSTDRNDNKIYNVDPIDNLVEKGARLIINISASPFCIDKWKVRENLLRDVVDMHGVDVVYVNAVGGQDSLIFDGHSMVMTPNGIAAEAASFREDIVFYDTETGTGDIHKSQVDGEVHDALVLGIRDYVKKTGHERVVIGISGGVDSAVISALCCEALSPENVYGVMMPSKYSSEHSISDAQKLMDNLGVPKQNVFTVPIQKQVDAYKEVMDEHVWPGFIEGLTEENLQARVRGAVLLSFANRLDRCLSMTSYNKSEASVGYGTTGAPDTEGAFAVIGDLFKGQVFELANYINRDRELIPNNTLVKPPSAELAFEQFDTDSLPPYPVLDMILKGYIEEFLGVDEIVSKYVIDKQIVSAMVRKVDINEFKRSQVSFCFKVSKTSFGSGRRIPIARKYN